MTNHRQRGLWLSLALSLMILLLLSLALLVYAGPYWHTSHGPEGGEIQALAVDSAGNLWAGTRLGWVFHGTFSGSNLLWTLENYQFSTEKRDVLCLAIDSADNVYAGTNEGGVWKCVYDNTDPDHPWKWYPISSQGLGSNTVRTLRIEANILYAGTPIGVYTHTLSTSGSWTKMGTPFFDTRALAVANGTFYAGCENVAPYWGVYRWAGTDWAAMRDGLPNQVSVRALIAQGSILYAGTGGYGVYECNTAITTTWTAKSAGLAGDALDVRALVLDGSTLYAGTEDGVYMWTGSAWTARSAGLEPGQAHSNARRIRTLLRTATGTLYAGTAGRGVYRTTDAGLSWSTANGTPPEKLLSAHIVRAIAVNPAYDWRVYAGTEGGGLYRSQDGGASWERRSGAIGDREVRALAVTHPSGFPVYAGTNDGIYTTTNAVTWTLASNGLTTTQALDVYALVIDPVSPTIVYAGTGSGVYKTTNRGALWVYKRIKPSGADYTVRALAIDPLTPTIVYAGTHHNGIYRSTDAGETWTAFNPGLSGEALYINALAVDIEHTVFAGVGESGGGIYIRKVLSDTWQQDWSAGGNPVYALVVNPITPTIVLAGTGGGGVLFYGDERYTPPDKWYPLNAQLKNWYVYSLAIDDYVTQTLHAGTAGSGVFDYTWGPPPPPPPELGISKSDDRLEVSLGQLVTYTLYYANSGDETATNIVITDVIPAHTIFVSSDRPFNSTDGRTYTTTIDSLGPGASNTIHFVVRVLTDTATAPDRLINWAYIGDDGSHGPDPREDNNATHDTTLLCWVDLQVTKSNGLNQVHPGQIVTYTLTYTNVGRSDAANVVLTEVFTGPAQYIGTGWTPQGGNRYSRTVDILPGNGGHGSTTFTLRVNDDAEGTLLNRVEISYDEVHGPDIAPGDNVAWDEDPIISLPPDLAVTKTDGTTYVSAGDILTYTITYTNAGPGQARHIVLTETIPAQTTFQGGADWHLVSGQTYTCTVNDLPAGEHATVTIAVQVNETTSPGPITNTVTIRATGETNPDNNTAMDVDWVVPPDLVIAKTDGTTYVSAGDILTYTITYTNAGSGQARHIVLTETIPAQTTFQGSAGWHLVSGQTYTCTVNDLPAGQHATVTITVQVNETASPGPITNTVTIRATGETNLDNNTATDINEVITLAPDLRFIYFSDGVTATTLCQTLTYTIRYANEGNKIATGVAITATLHPSATYKSGGWTALGNHKYRREVSAVPVGGTGEATLVLEYPAPAQLVENWPADLTVQVVIGCAEPENETNNTATDTNILRRPDLAVTGISTVPAQPAKDQPTTVRITLANLGDGPVTTSCCYSFYYDLYVNPAHAPGAGEYSNVGCSAVQYGLAPGAYQTVQFTYIFTNTGTYTLYAQVNPDRYPTIPERSYTNNTFGPFVVTVQGGFSVYLPLITRSYTP